MSAVTAIKTPPAAAPAAFASSDPGRRHENLPYIERADEHLEAAKAALARATAARDEKAGALNAARTELGNVLNTRTTEAALLAQAQAELVPSVLAGGDHDQVRARAQDAQTKIDALTSTAAILTTEAERLNVEVQRHHGLVGSAQNAVDEAELHALVAKYAKLIAPAIPLALEIRRRTNQWMDGQASCLLEPSDRRIGRSFKVADDGSVYFQM